MLPTSKANRYIYVALALSFLLAAITQLPRLVDPFLVEPGIRRFYLAHRMQVPALLPGQEMTYLELASPLYTLLLCGSSPEFPPAPVPKLLAFALLLVSVYLRFRIGQEVRGSRRG